MAHRQDGAKLRRSRNFVGADKPLRYFRIVFCPVPSPIILRTTRDSDMPNITKKDQDPVRWMTLKETVGQIQTLEHCGSVAAQRRLKATIGSGIIPVKWADSEGAKDIPDPRYLQGTKLILSGTGLAHDSHAYRPLMVLRSAFLRTWQHGKSNFNPSKEVEIAKHDATSDKHENEQAEWITLVEAEEHIEVLQDCDSVEALRQLKEEIGDGIIAVKWADESTKIPDVRILKYSEMILTGPGFAHNGKIYEQLLVNRSDILRIWPGAISLSKCRGNNRIANRDQDDRRRVTKSGEPFLKCETRGH